MKEFLFFSWLSLLAAGVRQVEDNWESLLTAGVRQVEDNWES